MKTLIVSCHPDDEAISCGGLIQNRLRDGHRVFVLAMCGRYYQYPDPDKMKELRQAQHAELQASLNVLGKNYLDQIAYDFCDYSNGEPTKEGYHKWLDVIEDHLVRGYDEVVIPNPYDNHQDHRHLHECCKIALRSYNLGAVKRILMWHALDGSYQERSTWFEPMTLGQLENKKNALLCYRTEVRPLPHPRALDNLDAHARVTGSQAGLLYAEPFTVYMIRGELE
jgi:LmbE family N-acetylglucosaminyl deacetylase